MQRAMIDRLIVFALRQRVFVLVLVAALTGFGFYALSNLPIEAFPDVQDCLLYTSPSPRDGLLSRMPSSA